MAHLHHHYLYRLIVAILVAFMPTLRLVAADNGDHERVSFDDADEVIRPVNSSYMFDVGSSHLGNTYLSPLKYVGWNVAFNYERMQAMKFSPESWRQQLLIGIEGDMAKNHAKNATMYRGIVSASWGMLHRWTMPHNLAVAVGGSAGANVGGVYSSRNGNNPATAEVDITLNATAYATWNTRLWRLPVMLRWQTTLPLTGVFFSPEYDELYYEMYLGNHSGLVHAAWPGNLFRWNNLVTADLDFSNTRLRLGFRSNICSTNVNHLTTRNFSYAFVIGVTGDWLSVSPRKATKSTGRKSKYMWVY